MYIDNVLLDILIEQLEIKYEGTHAPHRDTPLYGRCAYWRVEVKGDKGPYVGKITARVRSLNPKPATLKRLFRAELKKRIEAIHERITTNHYGQIELLYLDPYSIRPLLKYCLEDKYIDIHFKRTETMQSIYNHTYWKNKGA